MTTVTMEWESRLGRRLRVRDLYILATVVHAGSMGRAARELNMSQPAVSEAIANLEYVLRVRLLDRSTRGIEPTIYADAILKRSMTVFDELKQGVRDIEFLADPTTGELRIGATYIFASSLWIALVGQLTRRHPRIVLDLQISDPETAHRAVAARKVDLSIAHVDSSVVEERMHAEILYNDRFVVVAGTRNPWCRRRSIELADLVNEPWTLPSRERGNYIEAFRASGLEFPKTTVIANIAPVRIALVAESRFLTIVPESFLLFRASRPAVKRLPVDLPTATRPVGIITLKNRTLSPVARLFIDYARKVTKSMARQIDSRAIASG